MTVLLLSSFILNTSALEVKADDVEELLNVYNLTLGSPTKDAIRNELAQAESSLLVAEYENYLVEEYNAIVDAQRKLNMEMMTEIDVEISGIMTDNNAVKSKIENSIFTDDIESLLTLDREYKSGVSSINQLLEERDSLDVEYSYKAYNEDVDILREELETKRVLYAEALDSFDLGEVDNVPFPLDRDRYVTSKYGNRVDPVNPTKIRFHAGTDYRCAVGTTLRALFNGEVTSCGWSDTIGYFIVLQHGDNVKTMQCHLSEIKVTKGQKVSQGDVIGLTGGTGSRSTGPHLHLALYLNGATYDVDKLWSE